MGNNSSKEELGGLTKTSCLDSSVILKERNDLEEESKLTLKNSPIKGFDLLTCLDMEQTNESSIKCLDIKHLIEDIPPVAIESTIEIENVSNCLVNKQREECSAMYIERKDPVEERKP